MKQDRRGSWYLLTGAILGVVVGLFYSWVISPVEYIDAPPYALRADFKDEYRALVAVAYLYSGDLLRAEDRLAQLKDDNASQSLALQAQRALAEGHPDTEVRALGVLAMQLGQGLTPRVSSSTPAVFATDPSLPAVSTPTPLVNQPLPDTTMTPQSGLTHGGSADPLTSGNTLQLSRTVISTSIPGTPFVLDELTLACNSDQPQPMIQVVIQDLAGQPVAGVELVATWNSGEDQFFTGLQPELGMGYADFLMTSEVVYFLSIAGNGQVVSDLTAAECLSEDQNHYWGSWMLTIIQP